MKKQFLLLSVIGWLLFSGCDKPNDLLYYPGKAPGLCSIQKLNYVSFAEVPITAVFYYNKWGNPDSIVSHYESTGHPYKYIFNYDQQRRLTEMVILGGEDYYSFWSRYQYDSHNRIISDSLSVLGNVVNGRPQPPSTADYNWNVFYAYDQYNRIIKKTTITIRNFITTEEFIYNAQGNLVKKITTSGNNTSTTSIDVSQYDNKVSLLKTHPLWQFLACNYSVNNIVSPHNGPWTYNQYGLPVKMDGMYARFLLFYGDSDMQVTYKCK